MSRYAPREDLTMEQIDTLYRGSIDMHIHCAPDPLWDRRANAYEIARASAEGGMRAVVVKSFYYPTTSDARTASQLVDDVEVFGSVTIGYGTCGGLDCAPLVIENHAKMGCKVVWFPAFDAAYCRAGLGREGGIRILEDDGALKCAACEVLEVVRAYDMVLCKGHMSFEETHALFREAGRMGIEKMVATHPLSDTWGKYTSEQILELADLGAFIELTGGNFLPRFGSLDPADYIDLVSSVGAERCIMSTDLAQCMDPLPAEGMRFFIGAMLQFGCSDLDVELMAKLNPAYLLGLK